VLDVGAMTRFRDVETIKEADNRALRLEEAHDAVGRLRTLTARYREESEARERSAAAREAQSAKQAGIKQFSDDPGALRDRYMAMHSSNDPRQRGRAFEVLLTDLFVLFDMEPRLSHSLAHEQIDGSLSFDTDDYIVEARWRQESTSRANTLTSSSRKSSARSGRILCSQPSSAGAQGAPMQTGRPQIQ